MCGVWYNGATHFVVFYLCPDYLTIIDPLHSFTTPTQELTNNISTALATTYLHHKMPVTHLPPFCKVNRIAIQNDSPLTSWSCGTIAILTTLHLTLGRIRPDNINTGNITKRHIFIFHQALIRWLILGTPPNLWNIDCINKDIIRCEPIHFSESHSHCGFMQSLILPNGTNDIPHYHHTRSDTPTPEHINHNPISMPITRPVHPIPPKEKTKPPINPLHNNARTISIEPTPLPFKPLTQKLYPIPSHLDRLKRIAATRRRGTNREKQHHDNNQYPLNNYWPDIIPQSLPIALHPPPPAPTHKASNILSFLNKTPHLINDTLRTLPSPAHPTATPTNGINYSGYQNPHPPTLPTTPSIQPKTTEQTPHEQMRPGATLAHNTQGIILITHNKKRADTAHPRQT
jgi:hypothetical protein